MVLAVGEDSLAMPRLSLAVHLELVGDKIPKFVHEITRLDVAGQPDSA
jgi:hypothetical protein